MNIREALEGLVDLCRSRDLFPNSVAFAESALADPLRLYRCPECGSSDVEGETWVKLNSNEPTDDLIDGDYFCNDCEDHISTLCNVSTSAPFDCNFCNSTDCPGSRAAQKDGLK